MTHKFNFDNRLVNELPGDSVTGNFRRQVKDAVWSSVIPTAVQNPSMISVSKDVADLLDISDDYVKTEEFVQAMAGNSLLSGMQPYASCYGGHQFGHWAGQLGDGRAITLGEVINKNGERWEMQLKGAGPTPYSRSADGRAVMRSSIREYICSEAMHYLGVPTTRALCLVATGEDVVRDMLYNGNPQAEPGAIVCRVAPGFLRFGHFEILSSRRENNLLEQLIDFTISRDFQHINLSDVQESRAQWFTEICEKTAHMIVEWMRVGFVHGVMNTDNMSVLGLTIDYGPYGWLEEFDPDWTPNTTDSSTRRYRYGSQPEIAQWNLTRFAESLIPAFESTQVLEKGLDAFSKEFNSGMSEMLAGKFGFQKHGEVENSLIQEAFVLMHSTGIDFTLFFRALTKCALENRFDTTNPEEILGDIFYDRSRLTEKSSEIGSWIQRWNEVLQSSDKFVKERMQLMNPVYVPRNWIVHEAITHAEHGDYNKVDELLELMRRPYVEQKGMETYASKRPQWALNKVGCSMLSCSS